MTTLQSTERRFRRILLKDGYALRKSRAKRWRLDNQLGYAIVHLSTNAVVAGRFFDLNLDDIKDFVEN